MRKILQNKGYFNGTILAIFLFQYSMLMPLMNYVEGSVLIAISGVALIGIIGFINLDSKIKGSVPLLMLFLLFGLIFNTIVTGNNAYGILYFFMISFPAMVIFLFAFDKNAFLNSGFKLAYVNFFIIFLYPFSESYAYMRFGYGMLVTVLFLYIKIKYFSKNLKFSYKALDYFIICSSFLEMIIYGTRGAFFAVLVFIGIDTLCVNAVKIKRYTFIILSCIIGYANITSILDLLSYIAGKIGIFSYTLMKFQMQMESGLIEASSGRMSLYEHAMYNIFNNPIIGTGIFIPKEDELYVHNIFLQVAQDTGIPSLVLLILLLSVILFSIYSRRTKMEDKLIYNILFSVAIGRLMFSSSLWQRPEFWMLLFFFSANEFPKYRRASSRYI